MNRGCPKCGGLRQWPMGCVIRLPDSECGMQQPVDAIGIRGEFVIGSAGPVIEPTLGLLKRLHKEHMADLEAIPQENTPNPQDVLFDVTIRATELRRGGKHVPADVCGALYTEAVWAEMHETVREAVKITTWTSAVNENYWAGLMRERNSRALVEVTLAKSIKARLGGSAITNRGMSYMFQLRDDILAVINGVEPPEGAWVADSQEPQQIGEGSPMDENTSNLPAGRSDPDEGVPARAGNGYPVMPQLRPDDHAQALALAAATAHHPMVDPAQVERNAQNYLGEAKAFIAMFNTAISLLQGLIPSPAGRNPAPMPPPNPQASPAHAQEPAQG